MITQIDKIDSAATRGARWEANRDRRSLAAHLRHSQHKTVTRINPEECKSVPPDQCVLLSVQMTLASLKLIIDALEGV